MGTIFKTNAKSESKNNEQIKDSEVSVDRTSVSPKKQAKTDNKVVLEFNLVDSVKHSHKYESPDHPTIYLRKDIFPSRDNPPQQLKMTLEF